MDTKVFLADECSHEHVLLGVAHHQLPAHTHHTTLHRGVKKVFKILKIFIRQVRKQLAKHTDIVSEREKTLARLASGFAFLLANPEFYSHLAS
jgi:hypothetical protein